MVELKVDGLADEWLGGFEAGGRALQVMLSVEVHLWEAVSVVLRPVSLPAS